MGGLVDTKRRTGQGPTDTDTRADDGGRGRVDGHVDVHVHIWRLRQGGHVHVLNGCALSNAQDEQDVCVVGTLSTSCTFKLHIPTID